MPADLTALPETWEGCSWISRPRREILEVDPVTQHEDRPNLTLAMRGATYLRREFEATAPPRRALLWITALGIYEAFLNGERIGDQLLAPGFTDYRRRLHVQAFDVTDLVREGRNALGAVVADGWYAGYVGFDRGHQARLWGDTPALLARLEIDGVVVGSDGAWRRGTGPVVYADLQMGQMNDARAEQPGWDLPGFDDRHWLPVECADLDADGPELAASAAPPIRVIERRAPQSVTPTASGAWIADFGQNLVGVLELRVRGAHPGARIHLRHGEMLDGENALYTENLRTALAHDIYDCAGAAVEWFRPTLTFHGFRYAEISGYPGELTPDDLVARVVHSDVARIGTFECAHEGLTRLHENVDWTVRGNLLDVPTDCPQRDERLGWLGDAQLIMPSATFVRDLSRVLVKWTADIRDAQDDDGAFPDVAPQANLTVAGAPGWADGGVIVPWVGYLASGRCDLLADNYGAIRDYVHHLERVNPALVRTSGLNRNYGDWLNLDDAVPKPLLATAYFAASAETASHVAAALGHHDDAARFGELRRGIGAAFVDAFLAPDGRLDGDSQTGYAMALHLDLVPAALRAAAAQRLVASITRRGHLTTGIHGTRFLCPALSDTGHSRVAYDLVLATGYPSWLHAVETGATTIWERWDGWTAERGFQNPRMNSFNHYALGSVAEWLQRYVAGLTPTASGPGYRHVVVRPHPDARLPWAKAARATATGEVTSHWTLDGEDFTLTVEIPPSSSADIHVPTSDGTVVADGDSRDLAASGGSWLPVSVGPGRHRFRSRVTADWSPDPTTPPDRHGPHRTAE